MKNLFFLVLFSTLFFTACSTKQQLPQEQKTVEEEKANTPLSTWYYINYRTTVPDWENGDTILDVYKTHNGYYWEQVGRLDKQSSGLNIDINALFESSLVYFQKSLFFILKDFLDKQKEVQLFYTKRKLLYKE